MRLPIVLGGVAGALTPVLYFLEIIYQSWDRYGDLGLTSKDIMDLSELLKMSDYRPSFGIIFIWGISLGIVLSGSLWLRGNNIS